MGVCDRSVLVTKFSTWEHLLILGPSEKKPGTTTQEAWRAQQSGCSAYQPYVLSHENILICVYFMSSYSIVGLNIMTEQKLDRITG